MTRWRVTTDEAFDAVSGTVTNRDEVGPIDIVPVTPWLNLSVDRGRSEVLLAFSIEGAATAREDGVDLRWFSQLVGNSLADAVWYMLRSAESIDAPDTVDVEVEDDPLRDYLRLNYLFNIVHTAGWAGEGGWRMSSSWTVGDILGGLDLGGEVLRSAEYLVRAVLEGGTEGRAETRVRDLGEQGFPGDGVLNLIPSDLKGPCTNALIVFCFDNDNLERRLNEAIKHAGIHCPATRAVVFVTSKWDPKVWAELERDIVALRASFSVMMRGPNGQLARLR